MAYQKCPSCHALNDVGIYVSGTRVQCAACKLPFRVEYHKSVQANPAQVNAQVRRRESRRRPVERGQQQAARRPAQRPVVRPHPAVEKQPPAPRQAEAPAPAPTGQAAQPASVKATVNTEPSTGDLSIPGFQLYEVIGKGGMGKVYRAQQESLNRIVAIKVLNEDLAKHKSFIRRFEKETASLATLQHSNISTIYDRGNEGKVWFFVMEYIDGPSLRHKINRGLMDIAAAIDVFCKLCRAVAHAHQRGVIHRDLKPENVLFTSEDELKIVDFGLANILDDERRWSMTRTKVSMGTVNYMAPEQRRDAKNVTHMADIYSLGVMFYELLAGELPLGRFEPPSKHRPGVDPRLDQLVLKMLDFDPDERPQQADLVAVTAEAVLAELRPDVQPAPAGPVQPVSGPKEQDSPEPDAPQLPGLAGGPEHPAQDPPGEPPRAGPQAARPRPFRFSRALLWLLGGLVVLSAGSVAVFFLLIGNDFSTTDGDLVLREDGGAMQVSVVHPHQVMQVPPAKSDEQGQLAHFDFKSSRLPAVNVRFKGGNWVWDESLGTLVQDTCRSDFTVNQTPASAAFGSASRVPEGLEMDVSFVTRESRWDGGDGPVAMQRYLAEHLADVHRLARVESAGRLGLGFVDEQGQGLQVVIPLSNEQKGKLLRLGGQMEGQSLDFDMPEGVELNEQQQHKLNMSLADGRVRVRLNDKLVLDQLAGFAMKFKGYPALVCQNAVCEFQSMKYSRQAGGGGG